MLRDDGAHAVTALYGEKELEDEDEDEEG